MVLTTPTPGPRNLQFDGDSSSFHSIPPPTEKKTRQPMVMCDSGGLINTASPDRLGADSRLVEELRLRKQWTSWLITLA